MNPKSWLYPFPPLSPFLRRLIREEYLMAQPKINIPKAKIEDFCHRWKIKEFALFGSVLRNDFRQDSDIDVLVSFEPDGGITFDNRVEMLDELTAIFGRQVDLVKRMQFATRFAAMKS